MSKGAFQTIVTKKSPSSIHSTEDCTSTATILPVGLMIKIRGGSRDGHTITQGTISSQTGRTSSTSISRTTALRDQESTDEFSLAGLQEHDITHYGFPESRLGYRTPPAALEFAFGLVPAVVCWIENDVARPADALFRSLDGNPLAEPQSRLRTPTLTMTGYSDGGVSTATSTAFGS